MQNLIMSRITSKTRYGSIPVSISIQKWVRFFIMNIFLVKDFKLSKVKIWKMVWTVSKYPVCMTQKPWKGDFEVLKSKYFPWKHAPDLTRVGNRSVFILDPLLKVPLTL